MKSRHAYKIILDFIEPQTTVLDLGCGDGSLLALLAQEKNCRGTGIEICEEAIYECVKNGISVSHGDIDTELPHYSDKRFDYVILNESLQEVLHPQKVILEALRVGKKVIVGIPNFCHWEARWQIFFRGRVPVTKELPHEWFDTPNLRFLSLKDFQSFCKSKDIDILKERFLFNNKTIDFCPNLFANVGLFLLQKGLTKRT